MRDPNDATCSKKPTNAEILASVEAIGRLHHMLKGITDSLTIARSVAKILLDHAHALPDGIPAEAAVAVTKLRLEIAHHETLSLDTLRSVVEAIPVPEVQLETMSERTDKSTA